jgi:hypothetical protein
VIEFRVRPHHLLKKTVVEVWRDGVFIASITEGVEPASTLHFVTKHDVSYAIASSGETPLTTLAVTIRVRQ